MKQKIVKGLELESDGIPIDKIFDKKTGQYFAPTVDPASARLARLDKLEELCHKFGLQNSIQTKVVTAIVDTGLLGQHPWLNGRIVDSKDFTGEGPEDRHGHGTMVALIALLYSPFSKFLNVKSMDRNNEGTEEDVISGIDWAVNHGSSVINLSLGIERQCAGNCDLCSTVKKYAESGTYFAIAAGNEPDRSFCPANCKGNRRITVVGAADASGSKASYSAESDLLALGEYSLVPVTSPR